MAELNSAFLRAQLNAEALQLQLVKPKRNALSKIWVNKLMESTVVCTYTILSPHVTRSQSLQSLIDQDDDTFEVIRTFPNLRQFILQVGQIFSLLDRIAVDNRKFAQNLDVLRKHALKVKTLQPVNMMSEPKKQRWEMHISEQ